MKLIESYKFSEIKGFSRLFTDFTEKKEFILSRFPGNTRLIIDEQKLAEKAASHHLKPELISVIGKTIEPEDMTVEQKVNINKLKQSDCLAVVTGQQVGFLGGPLYTLLKAATAIQQAIFLKDQFPSLEFVSVFWIEDNDHDGLEASRAFSLNREEGVVSYDCNKNSDSHLHYSVSYRTFDDSIKSEIDKFIENLHNSPYKQLIADKLAEIYKPGVSWHLAFIKLMQEIFGKLGLLFICASEAIKSGVFAPLVLKELNNPESSQQIIMSANKLLEQNGYHIQAKASKINLFYNDNGFRRKIERDNKSNINFIIGNKIMKTDELLPEAEEFPFNFSPNVLLRPIFQDYLLPTAVYVAGPGEIGYCSQITELYDFFKVEQPAFIPRHSATIIDPKAMRLIERNNLEPSFFLKNFADIEHEISGLFIDESTTKNINKLQDDLTHVFDELTNLANNIDLTLSASVKSAESKAIQSIEHIEKKILSAMKRKNSELFQNYKYCSDLLYPNGSLQERIVSPLYFINQMGFNEFRQFIMKITELENQNHNFVTYV